MTELIVSPAGEEVNFNELVEYSPNGEKQLIPETISNFNKKQFLEALSVGIDLRKRDEMSKAEWHEYIADKLKMSVRKVERLALIGRKGCEGWVELIESKEQHYGQRFSYSMVAEIVSCWDYKHQIEIVKLWREDRLCLNKLMELTKAIKNGVPYIPQIPKRTFLREVKTKFGTITLKMEYPELNKITIEEVLPVLMKAMDDLHEDIYGEDWQYIYKEDFLREAIYD